MDISDIKEQWDATILDILKAFIRICQEHDLTYYCCAGTAIGAVRHNGIIPWDDDIDVLMPRPDYDRFIQIAQNKSMEKYEVITAFNNNKYPLYFSKLANKNTTLFEDRQIPCITGLYVDIFPLDGTSDDVNEAVRLKHKFTKVVNRLNAISTHNTFSEYMNLLGDTKEWGRFAIKTYAFFFRSHVRKVLLNQLENISRKHDYQKSKNVIVYSGSYGDKEVFPKEWLGHGSEFKFEDTTVRLPEQYDIYLRHFFNDYMQFPPEAERKEKHSRVYINLDAKESLKEVMNKII